MSDTQKAVEAVKKTFELLSSASFPIHQSNEVLNCLQFLDNLHTQLSKEGEVASE